MKKKYIILAFFLLLICGCTKINEQSIEEILNGLSKNTTVYNTYHTGYKYYLPAGLTETKYSLFNSVIESDKFKLYLYVDAVSYLNKTKLDYQKNNNSYFSSLLASDNKNGYVDINLKENNQYLIEIMFNYAKIELMVDEADINEGVNTAVFILRSIEYNDTIINSMLGEDAFSYQEEVYNIFNTSSSDSNYLKFVEEDQQMDEQQQEVNDTDLLK